MHLLYFSHKIQQAAYSSFPNQCIRSSTSTTWPPKKSDLTSL